MTTIQPLNWKSTPVGDLAIAANQAPGSDERRGHAGFQKILDERLDLAAFRIADTQLGQERCGPAQADPQRWKCQVVAA
jgi:hypothetical protein